eukprot:5056378-Pyramimonas_sp.AAC.1
MLQSMEDDLKKQTKKLGEKMAIHSDWLGAQLKIEAKVQEGGPMKPKEDFAAFLTTVARNSLRLGPAAPPLPVAAFFASPLSQDIFFIFWNAEAILRQGISLTDVKAFLSGESAEEFMTDSENVICIYAPKHSVIYVPWGWIPQPIYYYPGCRNKEVDAWQFILHIPQIVTADAAKMSDELKKAANHMNMSYVSTLTQSQWKERKAAWETAWAEFGVNS